MSLTNWTWFVCCWLILWFFLLLSLAQFFFRLFFLVLRELLSDHNCFYINKICAHHFLWDLFLLIFCCWFLSCLLFSIPRFGQKSHDDDVDDQESFENLVGINWNYVRVFWGVDFKCWDNNKRIGIYTRCHQLYINVSTDPRKYFCHS